MNYEQLKPESVFRYFHEICQVPRPSKREGKMIAYLVQFAQQHNLAYHTDEAGNVCIEKPATAGLENLKPVILQAHMDMVCEKNNDVQHDFDNDPIEAYVDGEWLRAKGTTLGADNGIGVAMGLAILSSSDIAHGPLECVFTVDEETGLTGAFAMKEGFMKGEILINLDSEDEGELFIGCAGGAKTTATFPAPKVDAPAGYFFFTIGVKGLTGGHSGDDINKGRANANKLLVRVLSNLAAKYDLYLSQIDGGNLHNAIPREASAVCAVPMKDKESVRVDVNMLAADIEAEYGKSDPAMQFIMQSEPATDKVIDRTCAANLIKSLYVVHHGVYAMSQDIEGLVETSSNLASVKMKGDTIEVITSQRSSIYSQRLAMAEIVRTAFEMGGATTETGEGYPGWKPNPDSPILKTAVESYKRLFGKEPKVKAIHAGLECGLFLEKNPKLDMVSFGPTMRGVHSPDERMLIATVEMCWNHLLDVLVHVPQKA